VRIIDCGAGNNPIPQADVILDKYPDDDTHRRGKLKVPSEAVFVQGDVQDMRMFSDKKFDFANCTHVIEHTEAPYLAIFELQRISKNGYVETPSFLAERLFFGSPNHKWAVVSCFANVMFFPSCGRPYQTSRFKFKLFRALDFLFNTTHTRIFWGHGKVIKYKLNNQSTSSIIRKIENFLSMTVGVSTQYFLNWIIFKSRRGRMRLL
jgi:hypothetical protein